MTKRVRRIVQIVTLVSSKTHNEKTANRELDVLRRRARQNRNQRLVIDHSEKWTKKLREEIDNLQRIVGGMTVPLRQFGEKSLATSR
jgi:CobQ-like glutamine amidotransferase family enzyme